MKLLLPWNKHHNQSYKLVDYETNLTIAQVYATVDGDWYCIIYDYEGLVDATLHSSKKIAMTFAENQFINNGWKFITEELKLLL